MVPWSPWQEKETKPEIQPESLDVSSTLEQGMNFETRHSNSVMFGPFPPPVTKQPAPRAYLAVKG